MMLKLGRIAGVLTATLTLAAATIPTKAEAADLFIPRGPVIPRAPVAYGGGGCGCQVRVPPPPCCAPPPCCVYGGGYGVGYGGAYGGGYGDGYAGGYGGRYGGGGYGDGYGGDY